MIKDYYNLKRQCLVPYWIGNKKSNVGDLNDKQLDIAEELLKEKATLTADETRQLDAIKYVQSYRSEKALERLKDDSKNRLNRRAEYIADNLFNVIKKSYTK